MPMGVPFPFMESPVMRCSRHGHNNLPTHWGPFPFVFKIKFSTRLFHIFHDRLKFDSKKGNYLRSKDIYNMDTQLEQSLALERTCSFPAFNLNDA